MMATDEKRINAMGTNSGYTVRLIKYKVVCDLYKLIIYATVYRFNVQLWIKTAEAVDDTQR